MPGGLQRFSLVLNVTSSARPGAHRLSAIKGVVTDSLRAWWTEYAPVVISSLPYHGYAPVRPTAWAEGFAEDFQGALLPWWTEHALIVIASMLYHGDALVYLKAWAEGFLGCLVATEGLHMSVGLCGVELTMLRSWAWLLGLLQQT